MNYRVLSALVLLVWLYCSNVSDGANRRFPTSRAFLVYRTVSVTRNSCTCPMSFSCSCCQSVFILYTKAERNLCVNFTYQRNGLNIDVSLGSTTIKEQTVTEYKAFVFCVYVPGTLFSSSCINIVELNQFPRSITACLRLDIYSKKKLWQINYDCVSISTELPMVATTVTSAPMGTTAMLMMAMSNMVTMAPATMAPATMAPAAMASATMAPAAMASATMAMQTMVTMMPSPTMVQTTTGSAQMNPNIEKLMREQTVTPKPMRIE